MVFSLFVRSDGVSFTLTGVSGGRLLGYHDSSKCLAAYMHSNTEGCADSGGGLMRSGESKNVIIPDGFASVDEPAEYVGGNCACCWERALATAVLTVWLKSAVRVSWGTLSLCVVNPGAEKEAFDRADGISFVFLAIRGLEGFTIRRGGGGGTLKC